MIVVGVGGSQGGLEAVSWAMCEAGMRWAEVESELLRGDPQLSLIKASKDADLLVVGRHGLGGFGGLLLGSVALGV
ncbi:universal stress protein [Streptosporangium sp. CA-135522]|uniref:universal stress protein n=1 Tax=Streptosporangium sp. CA-135522 TaxID=3240072 RepID=UPI003D8CA6B8